MMYFKVGDIIVYFFLIFIMLFPLYKSLFYFDSVNSTGNIFVTIDDKLVKLPPNHDSCYSFLANNQKIIVEVKSRRVRLLEDFTQYKIGVNRGWIDEKSNHNIVCLPLKVIVGFEKNIGYNNGIDAITF